MKKCAKLFAIALVLTLAVAALAITPSAAPEDLKPGSDKVMFIADGATGDGLTADSPLAAITHESFDASAAIPKNHLNTAFYQALEQLNEVGGGTLVICGPVSFGIDQSYGSGSSVKDVFTPVFGEKTIKITSVYNGVDYREKNGAKLTIQTPAMLTVQGQTIWENIDIVSDGTDRAISFCNYDTYVGEGVNCYPADSVDAEEGIVEAYISLAGGHRYAASDGATCNLTVMSGTYNYICGGLWGTVNTSHMMNATINLKVGGTTTVLGCLTGTPHAKSNFTGKVNITVDNIVLKGDIALIGPMGASDDKTEGHLVINGGDFTEAYTVMDLYDGAAGNAPAIATLDASNFKGDKKSLDCLYFATDGANFSEIKWPAGFTAPTEKPSVATTAAATQAATQAATKEATQAATTKKADDATKAPEATTGASSETPADEEGIPVWVWIVAAVVVVAIVVVILCFTVFKKKK